MIRPRRMRLGVGLAVSVFIIIASVGINRLFLISSIEVAGDGVDIVVDGAKLPKNLLFFPSDKIAAQLTQENPLVSHVSIRKKFPSTLVIVVTARVALAVVRANASAIVDREGVVLSFESDAHGLPIIDVGVEPGLLGESIKDPKVVTTLTLLADSQSFAKIEKITNKNSTSLKATMNKTSILFTQNSNAQALASTLQTLLTGFRIKGTMPVLIDLRYDKPIVKF